MADAAVQERFDTARNRHGEASTDWQFIDSARHGEQIAARLIPNRAYKNPDDFLEEFYRAERLTITHTLASA